jgi:putative toxin-antitoxin system antitoxin component (TIGR02293 family)
MPRTRKGVRTRRSSAFRNGDVRTAKSSLVTATLVRRKKADPEELTKAVARATEVLGDQDAALRWLGTPVAALDYATPVSVLGTPQGVTRVNDVLTQMEHGVW